MMDKVFYFLNLLLEKRHWTDIKKKKEKKESIEPIDSNNYSLLISMMLESHSDQYLFQLEQ